ncbi:hypothetical protein LINGRAHAP2_LOCUS6442 [Linum grandiflorum]
MCVAGLLMTSRNTNLNIMQDRLAMLWRPVMVWQLKT